MPFDRLLKEGKIKRYQAHPLEIQNLVDLARRDLATAERNLADAPDWAYSIAYNAVLQAGRALMLSKGYRPRGGEHHAIVVEFVGGTLGPIYASQVNLFDQMRRKRHRVIYESAGLISETEAAQAIAFSRDFVTKIIASIK